MSPATIVKPDAKASYAERILSVDYVVSDPAILPAIQAAMRGGRLPKPEANGRSYLKIPLDAFAGAVRA